MWQSLIENGWFWSIVIAGIVIGIIKLLNRKK